MTDPWEVTVNNVDYSGYWTEIYVDERLNEMTRFKVKLFGVDNSCSDVDPGNTVKVKLNNNDYFKGRIESTDFTSESSCLLNGFDMSVKLTDHLHNHSWSATPSTVIVNDVCSGVINIGTNTNWGTLAFDIINDDKLSGLSRLSNFIGYDWWVDESGGNDQFNIHTRRGGTVSQATFNTTGDTNLWNNVRRKVDKESLYNDIAVLGYGGGTAQIKGTASDATSISNYGTHSIRLVARTVRDTGVLGSIASTFLAEHKDPIDRIALYPQDVEQTFTLGDAITINDTDTGMSSNYKVVAKKLDLVYGRTPKLKIEAANKSLRFTDRAGEKFNITVEGNTYQVIRDPGHTHNVSGTTASHDHTKTSQSPSLSGNAASHDHSSYSASHTHNVVSHTSQTSLTSQGDGTAGHSYSSSSKEISTSWTNITSYSNSIISGKECFQLHLNLENQEASDQWYYVRIGTGTGYYPDSSGVQLRIKAGEITSIDLRVPAHAYNQSGTFYIQAKVYSSTYTTFCAWDYYWVDSHVHNINAITGGASSADAGVSATSKSPALSGNAASHDHTLTAQSPTTSGTSGTDTTGITG